MSEKCKMLPKACAQILEARAGAKKLPSQSSCMFFCDLAQFRAHLDSACYMGRDVKSKSTLETLETDEVTMQPF